jgi:hypothetical protein
VERLAVLVEAPLRLATGLVDEVLAEVDRGDGTGWALGVELRPGSATARLDREVRGCGLVAPDATFSFLKASTLAAPPDDALHTTAFHVDTHPGQAAGLELHRVLLNLGDRPRRVRIGRTVRPALERAGLVDPGDFRVRGLPQDTPVDVLELAPYDGERVAGLSFWPSVVPHVGVEDGPYLLVSYELAASAAPASMVSATRL